MGFFTDLFGGSPDPKPFGGGFDPAIEEDAKYVLGKLKENVEKGLPEYVGDRFADFTEEEVQAFDLLKELAFEEPEFFKEATGLRDEALELFKKYAEPIRPDDIAANRDILQPTVTAERAALQEALDIGLRDVGLEAALAGPGAATSSRQFLTALEQGKEFGRGTQRIESDLSERAIGLTLGQKDRLKDLATATYTASGDVLDQGQDEFQFRLGQAGLLGSVGEDKRALEQKQKDFEFAEFIRTQGDPNQLLRDYGNFISAAPLRQQQYKQDPSTFQELIGIGSVAAGIGSLGSGLGLFNKGGAIANLATGETPKSNFSFKRLKENIFGKKEDDELDESIKEIEEFSDEKFGTEYGKERAESDAADKAARKSKAGKFSDASKYFAIAGEAIKPKMYTSGLYSGARGVYAAEGGQLAEAQSGGILGSLFSYPERSQLDVLQEEAKTQFDKAMEDGKITAEEQVALAAGPVGQLQNLTKIGAAVARREPAPDAQGNIEDDAGFITKIVRGAGKGLQYYSENIDPFRGLTPQQRIRTGLAILAESPGLGESPLTTTARGALKGVTAAGEEDLARAKLKADKAKALQRPQVPVGYVNAIRNDIQERLGAKYDPDTERYLPFTTTDQKAAFAKYLQGAIDVFNNAYEGGQSPNVAYGEVTKFIASIPDAEIQEIFFD